VLILQKRSLLISLAVLAVSGLAAIFWLNANRTPVADQNCGLKPLDIGSFVSVSGGSFIKGADGIYTEEGVPQRVHVSPFQIQITEVTNDEFSRFVDQTNYVTEAEKLGGSALFVETTTPEDLLSWWKLDPNANWRNPGGEGVDLDMRGRLPVVHVTLNDARAYANWAKARLPSEVEWEYAASLGLFDPDDPLSGARGPNGEPRANIWNGIFPVVNTLEDGFQGLAPVGCFPANRIGVYDMIGNVWEWTQTPFGDGSRQFTIKGGSYLCSDSYCRRFRAAARESLEMDFSTSHTGIRLVRDIP
jgi:sulfatase modifying factor 1